MSSPTEEEEKIPSDFIHCVQKLLSSVSTLRKHLSVLTAQKETTGQNEALTSKLQAIKDAINSLAPAVHTAKQLASTSSIVERLTNEYSQLCDDYKKHYSLTMVDTRPFAEYKQYIERLSSWLSTTNANIYEVLQSVNKQRALLIIKNLDELSKYKSLLERATILNRTMVADLPDEQATKMTNEIADVKEQWRILIEGLNTLKERHASRYTSPERNKDEDRLAKQNENLIHYIESWFTLAKELIQQHEQLMMSNHSMIDDDKILHGSLISSDSEMTNPSLLCQLKECEQELNRLKNLLDESCRISKTDQMKTGEVTRSLADELTEIAKWVTTARMQLENRIQQQRGFVVELDSLINWLKNFINESKTIDNQTIKLALNERQQYFEELIKYNQLDDHRVKHKIENLIQMWNQLTSMSKF